MAICSSCGGSGIKRISEQRFRTCQDCLGRGELNPLEPLPQPLFSGHSSTRSLEEQRDHSAAVVIKAAVTSSSAR